MNIQSSMNYIQLNNIGMTPGLSYLFQTNSVPIFFAHGVNQTFDLFQATSQMLSKAFSITNYQITNITISNTDVYFTLLNGFNQFYLA